MAELNRRHAVYVGSFDPLTLGHLDIIRRGASLFDVLTVGVGINPEKRALFTPDVRVRLTREVLAEMKQVRVESFEGLTVDFVRATGAGVLLRGVRSLTDIDTEFTMSLANSVLAPDIETVFLMAGERFTHISSSLIKQIALMGKTTTAERLRDFVPEGIIQPLLDRVG